MQPKGIMVTIRTGGEELLIMVLSSCVYSQAKDTMPPCPSGLTLLVLWRILRWQKYGPFGMVRL